MTKLKALRDYPFDNQQRRAGDVFDASEDDARTLVQIGHAEYLAKPGGYLNRAVQAAGDDKPPPPPPLPGQRKGRYPRRDMRADD